MKNFFQIIIISLILIIFIYQTNTEKNKDINVFSSYYNSEGAFAGFIQKKNGLFRACEFSTNGSILSCSKWFDDETLKEGQNQGIIQEDI